MQINITVTLENDTLQFFRKQLESIGKTLDAITTKEAQIMSQIDDLNTKLTALGTAVDNIGTALTTLATDNAKALADLKAAIAAGGTGPDLTNQLQALDATNAKLATIATNIANVDAADLAADPATVTTPPAA